MAMPHDQFAAESNQNNRIVFNLLSLGSALRSRIAVTATSPSGLYTRMHAFATFRARDDRLRWPTFSKVNLNGTND